MAERIIFNLFAFILFIVMFYKMIRHNDTNYLYIIILEAVGIAIGFVAMAASLTLTSPVIILTYILSVIIPLIVLFLEFTKYNISELLVLFSSKYMADDKFKKLLLKTIEKYPNSYICHKLLGDIYEKEENFENALDELNRALEIKGEDIDLEYRVAGLYNRINSNDRAIYMLLTILEKKPEFTDASILLGNIYYEEERFKEALGVLEGALSYNCESFDLYFSIGMVYTKLNDFETAEKYYDKAANINEDEYAKYAAAQIALMKNEADKAEAKFTASLKNKDLEARSYYYLAYIAMLRGNKDLAEKYLNISVKSNPLLYGKAADEKVFKLILYKIEKPAVKEINSFKDDLKKAKIHFKSEETSNQKRKMLRKKVFQNGLNAIEHLEHTYELVGTLKDDDFNKIPDKRIADKIKEEYKEYKDNSDQDLDDVELQRRKENL